MNINAFFEKIHNAVPGGARLLGLTVADVCALIYDEDGFNRKDLAKIKKAYNLTDTDICEILFLV